MKNVGIHNQSVQQVYMELSKMYDVAFIDEGRNAEILISPSLEYYSKYRQKNLGKSLKCSVHVIVDYINRLMLVKGITILNKIDDIKFYKDTENPDNIRVNKIRDNYLYNILHSYEESTFQKIIQPLIYRGITDKTAKEEIKYTLVKDIFSRLKKDFEPQIKAYEKCIKKKQYEDFVNWLLSENCKKFARQLIAKKSGDLLDNFEVSYLHHVFKKGKD